MRVVFRADASPDIGGGHIMRCMTLADELRSRGHECTLVTQPESFQVFPRLKNSDLDLIDANKMSFSSHDELQQLNADIFVIDHYKLGRETETSARQLAPVMVFDDAPGRQHDCDMLLDPTFGRQSIEYKDYVPAGILVLCGSDYALVRPAFSQLRFDAIKRKFSDQICRIFVCFGATDIASYSEKITLLLSDYLPKTKIDVVLGSSTPNAISDMAALPANVFVHIDPTDLPELMAKADFAVGSAGSMSWERCCLALPSVIVPLVENQNEIAAALSQSGCAISITCDTTDIAKRVTEVVKSISGDPDRRERMSACAASICDGRGVFRLVDLFEQLANKTLNISGNTVCLRNVKQSDSEIIWAWRNDYVTRMVSETTIAVPWKEHCAWFKGAIENPDCLIFIACHSSSMEPIGIVRFNKRCESSALVSINLAPHSREKGIGKHILVEGCKQLLESWNISKIRARVLSNNTASMKLFQGAGFKQIGREEEFSIFELARNVRPSHYQSE